MNNPIARALTGILVAAAGIYFGLSLAVYSEADDAPGGVLIGALLMFGSLALGIWIALRKRHRPSPNDG